MLASSCAAYHPFLNNLFCLQFQYFDDFEKNGRDCPNLEEILPIPAEKRNLWEMTDKGEKSDQELPYLEDIWNLLKECQTFESIMKSVSIPIDNSINWTDLCCRRD